MTDATARKPYQKGSLLQEVGKGLLAGAVFVLMPALLVLGLFTVPFLVISEASNWFTQQQMDGILNGLFIAALSLCVIVPVATAVVWLTIPGAFGRTYEEE